MTYLYLKISYFLNRIFYPSPKIDRLGFAKSMGIDVAIIISLWTLFWVTAEPTGTSPPDDPTTTFAYWIGLTVFVAFLILFVRSNFTTLRRLHDIGYSAYCLFLLFIPLINLFIVFQLFFKASESDSRPYRGS